MKRTWVWWVLLWAVLVPGYGQSEENIRVFLGGGAYLGMQIRDIGKADVRELNLEREVGVYVEGVEEGSPASGAGLREGDVVVKYADVPVRSVRQLQRLVSETPPGREVKLVLVRQGEPVETTAQIDRRTKVSHRPESRIPQGRIEIPHPGDFDLRRGPGQAGRHLFVFSDRPRLGITAGELTEQMADVLGVAGRRGVLIMGVSKDSPAQRAGLKAGDVIVSIDGLAIESPHDLSSYLKAASHKLKIVRERKDQEITVQMGSGPRRPSGNLRL